MESNCSGQFSHVPSQPARIPSPRSMLTCDKRLQPETWHPSELQENVFANPRSTLESLQTHHEGTHPFMTSSAAGQAPALIKHGETCGKRGWKIRKHNSNADICKKAADCELLCSCGYCTEFHGWATKTADYRNFNLINSLVHHHFYVGRKDSETKWLLVLIFPRKLCKGSKKWRWSNQWMNFKILANDWGWGWEFPEFWNAGRENCFCFEQDHPKYYFKKKKIRLEEQKSSERGLVSSRKTDRLHDPRLLFELLVLVVPFLVMLILFFDALRDDNVQEFDTRWNDNLLLMTRTPPETFWKVCTNWGIGESDQPKNPYWNWRTWKFIRRFRRPIGKGWKQWWKE